MIIKLSKREKTLRWALLTALLVILLSACAILWAVANWQGFDEPVVKGGFLLREVWRFEADAEIAVEPAVGGSKVIIRTEEQLYALDARSGGPLWSVPVPSGIVTLPTPPLIGDDLVVVGYQSGVKALDVETGQLVWETPETACLGTHVVPAAMDETMVYVVRYDCNVRAYDRATGAVVWEVDLPGARSSANFFLDQDKSYLVVSGDLLILDSATGALVEEIRGQIGRPATYQSGTLYGFREGGDEDRLMAFDTQAETTLWVGPEIDISYPIGPPLAAGPRVFVATSSGRPMAVDAQTGGLLWIANVDSDMYQTPTVLNDTVYILGIGEGKIYALSTRNGAELGYLYTGDKLVIAGDRSSNWRPVAAGELLIVPLGRMVFAYGD